MTFDAFKEEVARRAEETGAEAFELYSVRNKTMEVAAHEGEVDTFSSDQDFAVNLRLLAGGRMGDYVFVVVFISRQKQYFKFFGDFFLLLFALLKLFFCHCGKEMCIRDRLNYGCAGFELA